MVKGLIAGDEESLAKLYDIYAERLFDYCWSSLGEVRASANIVHDTLIDAYRRVGRLRDRDRLRAWLYASARRRCLQQGRGAAALTWTCTAAKGGIVPGTVRLAAFTREAERAGVAARDTAVTRNGTRPGGTSGRNGTSRGNGTRLNGSAGHHGIPELNGAVELNGAAEPNGTAELNGTADRAGTPGTNGHNGSGRNGTRDSGADTAGMAGNRVTGAAGGAPGGTGADAPGAGEDAGTSARPAAPPAIEVAAGAATAAGATRGAAKPVPDETETPDELCRRIQRAFHKLAPADQEALFLATRHDLDTADLSVTLGESQRRVQARVTRGHAWMSNAVPVVAAVALDLHAAPEPPCDLRHRVLHAGSDPELAGHRADIVARAGGLDPQGFPRQPDARLPIARRWLFASTGLTAAITLVAVLLMLFTPVDGPGTWPFDSAPQPQPSRSMPSTGRPPQPGPENGPGQGARPAPADPVVPPGSTSPRPSVPAGPVRLLLKPDVIHLVGHEETAKIRLRAENGSVAWRAADDSPLITLADKRGTIPAGAEEKLEVRLNRAVVQLPGTATVTVVDDTGRKQTVRVYWSLSLL